MFPNAGVDDELMITMMMIKMMAVLQDDDSRDQSDIVIVDTSAEAEHSAEQQLPDSDFDDFDSGDEEEASMGAEQQHGGSQCQDNEIHEIYLVQDSKQTRVMGKQTIAQMLYKTGRLVSQFRYQMKVLYKCQEIEIVLLFCFG